MQQFGITPSIMKDLILASWAWMIFWKAVYALAPPREMINSPKYDKFLLLVHYYGSINPRRVFMQLFYGAKPEDSPPLPKPADAPAAPIKIDSAPPKG